mmetsp:Transcript_21864/g.62711  ORF Transcript_21864/g.62711 Transcript_21864/m.62711 type:complete len:209 (+) Transcript_21864:149-775(+)
MIHSLLPACRNWTMNWAWCTMPRVAAGMRHRSSNSPVTVTEPTKTVQAHNKSDPTLARFSAVPPTQLSVGINWHSFTSSRRPDRPSETFSMPIRTGASPAGPSSSAVRQSMLIPLAPIDAKNCHLLMLLPMMVMLATFGMQLIQFQANHPAASSALGIERGQRDGRWTWTIDMSHKSSISLVDICLWELKMYGKTQLIYPERFKVILE